MPHKDCGMENHMKEVAWIWVVGMALAAGTACSQGVMPAQTDLVTVEQMNEAFGMPLWVDTNLWANSIEETVARLNGRLASSTETESSYRIQPANVLDLKPEMLKLLGKNGKVVAVLIMFANKGDTLLHRQVLTHSLVLAPSPNLCFL